MAHDACTPDPLDQGYPEAELVIGLVCAVGVDYAKVSEYLSKILPSFGYRANVLRVSSFIRESAARLGINVELHDKPEELRLSDYMDAGNMIRKETKRCDFFATVAAAALASSRSSDGQGAPTPLLRRVHVILTLKRPEEVEVLRRIYGPGFFLVGLFAEEHERLDYLMNERNVSKDKALKLIARDLEDEDREFGQRTRDTFHLADVFVELQKNRYKQELKRFLQLVFGHPHTTPTPEEFAMYQASAASLRSGQLGRQVGAAIVNERGDLIAVGCNEVPAPGGGGYWPSAKNDHRDHTLGEDSNDKRKEEIILDVLARLKAAELLSDEKAEQLLDPTSVLRKSLLGDITEFGRAVHAEMDALLTCARGGASTLGGTLYTTTFPCHNCTRHVIAAGITKVVYIEPYPKSQAGPLHKDAIRIEDSVAGKQKPGARDSRIPFKPFIGIGPRRYFDLFSMSLGAGYPLERKTKAGETVPWSASKDAKPRIAMAPTSYLQREILASKTIYSIFNPK